MMKKTKKIAIIFLLIILILTQISIADMGAKPSITIKLKNMNTTNYLIDLLVYDENGQAYDSPMYCNDRQNPTDTQIRKLYKINDKGWISEGTRWDNYLLMTDIIGNSNYEHHFGYFGTPDTYKIIIMYDSGEIKISDTIHRTEFTSYVTLDVNHMRSSSQLNFYSVIKILVCMIITILVEWIVAYILRKKLKFKNVIIVNMISQIFLQLLLILIKIPYLVNFIILEVLIIPMEYFLYRKLNDKEEKLVIYVIIANFITALLTFFVI